MRSKKKQSKINIAPPPLSLLLTLSLSLSVLLWLLACERLIRWVYLSLSISVCLSSSVSANCLEAQKRSTDDVI